MKHRREIHENIGEVHENSGLPRRFQIAVSLLKLAVFALICIGIPVAVVLYHPEIIEHFRSLEDLNAFLERYHTAGIFVYLAMQVVQILVPVIPGQALQLAAGYMYHFLPGLSLSLLGIAMGTAVSFGLSRFLGHDAMVLIFGEEKIHSYINKLNSKRAYQIIFLLYLMPGFPKDFICFAAGISEIRFLPFLILSLVGRTPALMLSLIIGSMTRAGSYQGAVVVAAVAAVLFLLFLWKRRSLMKLCDEAYERLTK